MKRNGSVTVLALATLLAGCASPGDHVLFVTKSSLGIDLDGAPASASIAYDRTEGYLGPRFENGSVPPVVAKISSNGLLLGRDVRQYYATGTAANLLVGSKHKSSKPALEGDAKPMFFGTSTTLGIKIGFTTTVPDTFVFGYRRKELSLIPIGTTHGNKHHYPSVIGVFSSDTEAKTVADSALGLTQFFATGTAAEKLAGEDALQKEFKKFATDAVAEFKDATRDQQRIALALVACFMRVPDPRFGDVLVNAEALDLFSKALGSEDIRKTASEDLRKARADYVSAMSVVNVDPPDRTGRLRGHQVYVCGLKG